MLFAYFVSAYFTVCVPCFSALAVCNLKGSQAPNLTAPTHPHPSFRATASHKPESNSVTIAQPPLHTRSRTRTNLTWLECTWKEWRCSVPPSAVEHFEAFLPFQRHDATPLQDGETQTLLRSLILTIGSEPNGAVLLQGRRLLWGICCLSEVLVLGALIYHKDLQFIQMTLFSQYLQSIECDDNNPAVASFFNLYNFKYCVVFHFNVVRCKRFAWQCCYGELNNCFSTCESCVPSMILYAA